MHIRNMSSMVFLGGDSIPHGPLLPSCIVSEKKCPFINSDIMAVTHINLLMKCWAPQRPLAYCVAVRSELLFS